MTSYPQQRVEQQAAALNSAINAANGGQIADQLADPGVRLALSLSPQDGALKALPENLKIQELSNGSLRVAFPDGSMRELIPGVEGEGRMITTLPDGTRIQSDLTTSDGQVTIASISSTGEKTFLSLNENGANMQRITADGEVTNVIPESATELMQSFREAEAFSQAQELREQEQFQPNSDFGDWNNFGKPVDWQPEQNWQPPQQFGEWNNFGKPVDWQPQQNWQPPQFDGGFMPPQQNWQPPQQFGEWNNFGKPVDWQPQQNWQPPQFDGGYNQPNFNQPPATFMPPQQFGEWNNFGKPVDWQPEQNWQPPQQNWQPPQFDGGYNQPIFNQPPATFMPPQGNWQPPQFDGGYNQPIFNQPPATFMPPQQFGEWNNFGKPVDWQPQPTDGFQPSAPTDSSGFPIGPSDANAFATPNVLNVDVGFANGSDFGSVIEDMFVDSVDDSNPLQQLPPQY
ncbi:MAG: hypothetical protein EBT44_02195 [Actinobacteria bacterium]|uniref:Uncharacterized protein n=1 Tax=Candidatus Fonsibacter lacus TaxID=2576439 RepID=A0A965GDM2_9PROT|nr:hypothetical protein [Candidatus Fonsibacter lacus]